MLRHDISVVIPCWNQARFLGDAIDSVRAQTVAPVEIVVVDDGSADDTAEVARRHAGGRCLRQPNRGASAARNAGLRATRGRHVVFLDADDRLLPHALQVGLEALEAHPDWAFASGGVRLIDSAGVVQSVPDHEPVTTNVYERLLRGNYIWTPGAVIYRRAPLERAGGFDETALRAADYELNLRLAAVLQSGTHPHVVLDYRLHGANISGDPAPMLAGTMRVLRAHEPRVRAHRKLRAALAQGVQENRDGYGAQLLDEVRDRLRHRDWRRAARGLLTLLRYDPARAIQLLRLDAERSGLAW